METPVRCGWSKPKAAVVLLIALNVIGCIIWVHVGQDLVQFVTDYDFEWLKHPPGWGKPAHGEWDSVDNPVVPDPQNDAACERRAEWVFVWAEMLLLKLAFARLLAHVYCAYAERNVDSEGTRPVECTNETA